MSAQYQQGMSSIAVRATTRLLATRSHTVALADVAHSMSRQGHSDRLIGGEFLWQFYPPAIIHVGCGKKAYSQNSVIRDHAYGWLYRCFDCRIEVFEPYPLRGSQ